MEYVSIPRAALAARWRPVSQTPQSWRPAPAQMSAPLPTTKLGQISPLSVMDVGLDFATASGAMLVGFSFALFGPKDAPTWRWIGGLVGAIGGMRILNSVGKLGV
jgi:hypothetical protein